MSKFEHSDAKFETVGEGITAIDTEYVRPRMDASHLIVDRAKAAYVDTGTNHSVPNLLEALNAQGLEEGDVEYVFLTHVHLDHAGGAGLLARHLPGAKFVVHPRGVSHLVDPVKLIAGTRAVYGDAHYARLYGDILPIDADRIVAVRDGDQLDLGGRRFAFLHTPGHALHHVCIVDAEARAVFSGDTFGVSYREFDNENGEFVIATTTPTQFDPEQLHASVDRILEARPTVVYMTHYSRVNEIERLGRDMHADIDRFVEIARAEAGSADRIAAIGERMFDYLSERLDKHHYTGGLELAHALLDKDVELNAAGLDAWLARSSR